MEMLTFEPASKIFALLWMRAPVLYIHTRIDNFVNGAWEPPDGSIDVIADAIACLAKFSNTLGAPVKSLADLEPRTLDMRVGITDVLMVIEAFRGLSYSYEGPDSCP